MEIDRVEISEFIRNHHNEDVATLRLKYTLPWQRFAIVQIEARHKCAAKLPSYVANEGFLFPSTVVAEQATNEIIAKFHASLFEVCDKVVDLTAGLCVDAMEISKNCHVDAIEINEEYFHINRANIETLGADVEIINADSAEWVKTMPQYSAAFIDPARRDNSSNRVYSLNDCSPNLLEMIPYLKQKVKFIIVKSSPILNIAEVNKNVEGVSDFWVVSLRNECKELLFKIDFEHKTEEQIIHTINFTADGTQTLSMPLRKDEIERYGIPEAGDYLYEPNSSIMKAMLFDGIYAQYGDMLKIAPNSHLFFSKNAFLNFPGRIFKIREIALFKKGKSLDTIKGTKANVATRNFPLSASELSRKLKIKDGGETYLFGTTLSTKQTVLLVCEKATF